MKAILFTLFQGLWVWGFCFVPMHACAADAEEPADSIEKIFRAGAATSNITPFLGAGIIGGWSAPPATHIHDELRIRCLALDDGSTRLVLATVDNVQIPREIFDAAKKLIHEATGIPKKHLMISATHTHSAPSARGTSSVVYGEPLDDYQEFVIRRIADGVQRAVNNLERARIGWGTGKVPRHVFNRRWLLENGKTVTNPFGTEDIAVMNPGRYVKQLLRPAGPVNPRVYFLSVEATDGRPIALLANYWLHYVGGVGKGHISADYFGVFSERIGELLETAGQDPPFVGMLCNGASGDINNNDYANYGKPGRKRYQRYEKMREVAEDLAREVVRVREKIEHHDWVKLRAAQTELELQTRRPTPEQVERAEAILGRSEADASGHGREAIFARRTVAAAEWPESLSINLQAFRIGELGIAAIPFEVFTEIGLEIEERSPFADTFIIGLANGGNGYLPSPEQHELGGYETWLTVNRVEKEASPKIVTKLMELFAAVKD